MNKLDYISEILPDCLRKYLNDDTEEIRLRVNSPAIFLNRGGEVIAANFILSKAHIDKMLDVITKSSIYAFFEDINNGFITISGGHRIGLAGSAVMDGDRLSAVKNISFLNIRVASEIKGVGERLYGIITDGEDVKSTLIISPPGCGKTTLLRDLTRLISNNIKGAKIALIDERGEIAASYMGEPQNDVGIRTDVFSGYSKKDGIIRAVRSMSPTIIVTDEIGGEEDFKSIELAKNSGVGIIASVHGNNYTSVKNNKNINFKIFEYCVIMKKNNTSDRIEKVELIHNS